MVCKRIAQFAPFLILSICLFPANDAAALVAGGSAGLVAPVATAFIIANGVASVIGALIMLVAVPSALSGLFLRVFRGGSVVGAASSAGRFAAFKRWVFGVLKFLAYHVGYFYSWVLTATVIAGLFRGADASIPIPLPFGNSLNSSYYDSGYGSWGIELVFGFVLVIVYTYAWAALCLYGAYVIRKMRGMTLIRPSLGAVTSLAAWTFATFLLLPVLGTMLVFVIDFLRDGIEFVIVVFDPELGNTSTYNEYDRYNAPEFYDDPIRPR